MTSPLGYIGWCHQSADDGESKDSRLLMMSPLGTFWPDQVRPGKQAIIQKNRPTVFGESNLRPSGGCTQYQPTKLTCRCLCWDLMRHVWNITSWHNCQWPVAEISCSHMATTPALSCPALWQHETHNTHLTLVINEFSVLYTNHADATHVMDALKENSDVPKDWEATKYCGLTLQWDYNKHTIDICMPGYIEQKLKHFQHVYLKHLKHAPHAWQCPIYVAKIQCTPEPNHMTALDAANWNVFKRLLCTCHWSHEVGCPWHINHAKGQRHSCNHGSDHPSTQTAPHILALHFHATIDLSFSQLGLSSLTTWGECEGLPIWCWLPAILDHRLRGWPHSPQWGWESFLAILVLEWWLILQLERML